MASVKNRFCVPIVGVCMAAQMMLVTPYMPLGCLLDYVRKNKENIPSKVMLTWCAQIAQVSQVKSWFWSVKTLVKTQSCCCCGGPRDQLHS